MSGEFRISQDELDQFMKDLNHRVWEVRRDACEKLGECGDCIETVVGVGYRFVGCPAKV